MLETDIQALTAAIVALTARLAPTIAATPPTIPAATETAPAPAAESAKPGRKPKAVPLGGPETVAATAAAVEPAKPVVAASPAAPAYDQVREVFLGYIKKNGRGPAEAVLKKFNATKLPEVKPEDFAALIAACEAGVSDLRNDANPRTGV